MGDTHTLQYKAEAGRIREEELIAALCSHGGYWQGHAVRRTKVRYYSVSGVDGLKRVALRVHDQSPASHNVIGHHHGGTGENTSPPERVPC